MKQVIPARKISSIEQIKNVRSLEAGKVLACPRIMSVTKKYERELTGSKRSANKHREEKQIFDIGAYQFH